MPLYSYNLHKSYNLNNENFSLPSNNFKLIKVNMFEIISDYLKTRKICKRLKLKYNLKTIEELFFISPFYKYLDEIGLYDKFNKLTKLSLKSIITNKDKYEEDIEFLSNVLEPIFKKLGDMYDNYLSNYIKEAVFHFVKGEYLNSFVNFESLCLLPFVYISYIKTPHSMAEKACFYLYKNINIDLKRRINIYKSDQNGLGDLIYNSYRINRFFKHPENFIFFFRGTKDYIINFKEYMNSIVFVIFENNIVLNGNNELSKYDYSESITINDFIQELLYFNNFSKKELKEKIRPLSPIDSNFKFF